MQEVAYTGFKKTAGETIARMRCQGSCDAAGKPDKRNIRNLEKYTEKQLICFIQSGKG